MRSKSKDFNVAIIGGGMCGLACAVALSNGGIDVTVFEASTEFKEVGAGVGIAPNAMKILEILGMLDALLKRTNQPEPTMQPFMFISGMGNHEVVFDYTESTGTPNIFGISVHRPAFLEALMPLLPPGVTHFNKRCTYIEETLSRRQLIHFADSSTFEADLVVGADGIKSNVRKMIVGEDRHHLCYSNQMAYRGLVSIKSLKAAGLKTDVESRALGWVGSDKHLITYLIKEDTLNVAALTKTNDHQNPSAELPQPWVENVPQKELLDAYEGWGEDAMIILRHLRSPSRWSVHTVYPPLKTFVKGHIVLIGDAAHAMVPHLGAGIGQGLEDVYSLFRLLTHPDTCKSNLETVLAVHNKIRPPRAAFVLERSIRMGELFHGHGEGRYSAEELAQQMRGMYEPTWYHDIVGELDEAIKEMERASQEKMPSHRL